MQQSNKNMHDEPTFYFSYAVIRCNVKWIFCMTARMNIFNEKEILRGTDSEIVLEH